MLGPLLPLMFLIPLIVSAFLLLVELFSGELSRLHLGILIASFLLAGYLQFFSGSAVLSAAGVVVQALLAIYMRLRAMLAEHSA